MLPGKGRNGGSSFLGGSCMQYYVYGHYTLDGRLFYVGKGTGRRAWERSARNPHWNNVVNKHGLEVRILFDSLTEEDAFIKEKELIEQVGLDKLTNIVEGGRGLTSKDLEQRWADPIFRERMRSIYSSPVWKERINAAAKKRFADPSYLQKLSKRRREVVNRPEWKEKQSRVVKTSTQASCIRCRKTMLKACIFRHHNGKCDPSS